MSGMRRTTVLWGPSAVRVMLRGGRWGGGVGGVCGGVGGKGGGRGGGGGRGRQASTGARHACKPAGVQAAGMAGRRPGGEGPR